MKLFFAFYFTHLIYNRLDFKFEKRRTGKDKERRNRELYGNHSAKHIRIQEHCQENHLKNIHGTYDTQLNNKKDKTIHKGSKKK